MASPNTICETARNYLNDAKIKEAVQALCGYSLNNGMKNILETQLTRFNYWRDNLSEGGSSDTTELISIVKFLRKKIDEIENIFEAK